MSAPGAVVLVEPSDRGEARAASRKLDVFAAQLGASLGRPVPVVEGRVSDANFGPSDVILLDAFQTVNALESALARGMSHRVLLITNATRGAVRGVLDRYHLAGVLGGKEYDDWRFARYPMTARGLWARLRLIPEIDARPYGGEHSEGYSLVESVGLNTLPALISAYVEALLRES